MYTDNGKKHTFEDKRDIAYKNGDREAIFKAVEMVLKDIDEQYGGFGTTAKTTSPEKLLMLLKYYRFYPNAELLKKIEKTLYNMYKGGIFDHLGYGFFKCSKVRQWTEPVLQKMLYDNLILIIVYAEAYDITNKKLYCEIVEKIYAFLARDMMDPKGGFYFIHGEDNETDNKLYSWSYPQIEEVLGKKDAAVFCKYYNIPIGVNGVKAVIPNQIGIGINKIRNDDKLSKRLISMCNNLYLKRQHSESIQKDIRIYSSLNSLAVAALAYGGRLVDNSKLIASSEKTLRFIFTELSMEDRQLVQYIDKGKAEGAAHQRTYAYLTWGLIELYYATLRSNYLKMAAELNKKMINNFWDGKGGGFFTTEANNEKVFRNTSSINGNIIALLNFLNLIKLGTGEELEIKTMKLTKLLKKQLEEQIDGLEFYIIALIEKNNMNRGNSEETINLMAEVVDTTEKD